MQHGHKEGRKVLTEDKRQEKWSNGCKAIWTRILIRDVRPWVGRAHGQVDYYTTEFLPGHGIFDEYLCRIGKAEDANCRESGQGDTAEHAVFQRPRWPRERREMEEIVEKKTHNKKYRAGCPPK
ncbi:hypothetical protein NQ315_002793 [Exocentrus adspersus]|uniref:Uncharacterized protein n=1 Tax=Exocentrus adspersus TaxID=1586481 RepID=A0AAV8VK18_9CUCU|nr:hypothetical protein NQ315_002793 [Exocentrus adspersus]